MLSLRLGVEYISDTQTIGDKLGTGVENTSLVVPSWAMSPSFITAIRSETVSASL